MYELLWLKSRRVWLNCWFIVSLDITDEKSRRWMVHFIHQSGMLPAWPALKRLIRSLGKSSRRSKRYYILPASFFFSLLYVTVSFTATLQFKDTQTCNVGVEGYLYWLLNQLTFIWFPAETNIRTTKLRDCNLIWRNGSWRFSFWWVCTLMGGGMIWYADPPKFVHGSFVMSHDSVGECRGASYLVLKDECLL